MANRTTRTPKKRKKFIASLRLSGGNVSRACKAEGVPRRTAYEWREQDEDFARDWDEAVSAGVDDLEEEARRRAFKGTRKPVYQGGERVGYIQEYSDTLLIFLLKGAKPDKYKDRQESSQSKFDFNDADLSTLNAYELERIIAGDDPRSVFSAARARRIREAAQAG